MRQLKHTALYARPLTGDFLLTSCTSLVSPVIVGRTHDLDALERHLGGGGPPVVVVSGEAGISKSHLIAEAKRRAWGRGILVLQGTCYESDRVPPYAPLLDLLRALCATVPVDESAPSVGAAAAPLAVLLPELYGWQPVLRRGGSDVARRAGRSILRRPDLEA
jgi:hypothetical protein